MKFSDFEVTRVGGTIALRCMGSNGDMVGGMTITISFNADDGHTDMYEELLRRLCTCARLHEDVADDVLQAMVNLTKGKDT